jgi:phosphoribosylanthranilate isomerase
VAAEHGADLLGFIFAPSRRQVTAEGVARIIADVRSSGHPTRAVGVFVDPDPVQLVKDIEISGIELVQLSGDESPGLMRHIPVPVIKAFPAGVDDDALELRDLASKWAEAQHIMLDASDPNARGGTGKRANWLLASTLTQHIPIVLAGGLDPDNIDEAIRSVKPFGVDVSSGVETNGLKDPEKIDLFIRNAREAFEAVAL